MLDTFIIMAGVENYRWNIVCCYKIEILKIQLQFSG